jgi:phage repressor protein C with HTH and peptisase S24 domain
VAQWESTSGSSPSGTNLAELAVKLGCSYEWLATGRGSRTRSSKEQVHPAEDPAAVLRYFASTEEEEHILATFRQLDLWDQVVVTMLAESLASRPGSPTRRKGLQKLSRLRRSASERPEP